MANITAAGINNIEDIVDKSIIEKNGWMMYGSCKPGHQVYKLKYIFDYT